MFKILLGVVVAAAAGWWYFVGGRTLSEADVRGFYQDLETATLNRKPEDLCALLAEGYESAVVVAGAPAREPMKKREACDAYRALYATFEQLGEKMGGELHLGSDYQVTDVEIGPDRKSATARFKSTLDIAGTVMHIRSNTTDTLIRRNGKVLLLRSTGRGTVSSG